MSGRCAPPCVVQPPRSSRALLSGDRLSFLMTLIKTRTHAGPFGRFRGLSETVSRWILFGTTSVSQRERRRRISRCLSSVELLLNAGRKRMCESWLGHNVCGASRTVCGPVIRIILGPSGGHSAQPAPRSRSCRPEPEQSHRGHERGCEPT